MKIVSAILALCLCALFAGAVPSTRKYAIIDTTNNPAEGNQLIIDGIARTWKAAVANATNEITRTNSIGGNKTNLMTQLQNFPLTNAADVLNTASNAIVIAAQPGQSLTVSVSGTWATITFKTNPVGYAETVAMPFTVESGDSKTNIASGLVDAIDRYSTNRFSETNQALGNYVSRGQAQTVSNKTLTSVTVDGARGTNLTGLSGTIFLLSSGRVYAVEITNCSFAGTLIAMAGGTLTGTRLTNAAIDHAWATNVYLGNFWSNVFKYATLMGTIDKLTNGSIFTTCLWNSKASNSFTVYGGFNAPGSGSGSQQIGGAANGIGSVSINGNAGGDYSIAIGDGDTVASGYRSTVIGAASTGSGTNAIIHGVGSTVLGVNAGVIGNSSFAQYDNSFAWGNGINTTKTNQFRIGGTSNEVFIPGTIVAGSIINSALTGNTTISGSITLPRRTAATLVNGNNSQILLGTNPIVALSGASGTANICSFLGGTADVLYRIKLSGGTNYLIVNESGADSTAANRIKTGTPGDVLLTNSTTWIEVIWDPTDSRWNLVNWTR
jgi:hypothetical protein